MSYKNKTVWITGASSGIGEAFAKAFYKDGANLILSSRRKDELERVKKDLGSGDTIKILPPPPQGRKPSSGKDFQPRPTDEEVSLERMRR